MRKIMFFILELMLNMVPALAEGEEYSARYVSLGRQSAVVYQPIVKSAKTGIGIVVMHFKRKKKNNEEDFSSIICTSVRHEHLCSEGIKSYAFAV